MPDGTDLDPLPVVLFGLRGTEATTALAAKSQGRWTVLAWTIG